MTIFDTLMQRNKDFAAHQFAASASRNPTLELCQSKRGVIPCECPILDANIGGSYRSYCNVSSGAGENQGSATQVRIHQVNVTEVRKTQVSAIDLSVMQLRVTEISM